MKRAGGRLARLAAALVLVPWVAGGLALATVTIKGTVVAVRGQDVQIKISGDELPVAGDEVSITFRIPGGPELKVGTWRVSQVGDDLVTATLVEATGTPAVDQEATIVSASPTRRGARAAPAPPPAATTGPPPGAKGAPPEVTDAPAEGSWAPGASAPTGFPRSVGIERTLAQLPLGPMRLGDGRFERRGAAFVMSSSQGYETWESLSTQPARDFYAGARIRAERTSSATAVAGLLLTVDGHNRPHDGDIFFGKDDVRGLLLGYNLRGVWLNVPLQRAVGRLNAGDLDWFEIVRRAGQYEFRLNGALLATTAEISGDPQWILAYAGAGCRGEFHAWSILRPE